MREIYLDYNATTPMYPEVAEALREFLEKSWGNPSSVHRMGLAARELREKSRKVIAKTLGAKSSEIVFTSGGTEANNLAIWGVLQALSKQGESKKHILTTQIEHPSVYAPLEVLQKKGYQVTFLAPDHRGIVTAEKVEAALRDDTVLVSVMTANNETGALQPIRDIGKLLKSHPALFHTDAVQAFGKIPLNVEELGVDLLSLSAHKLGGPLGVGLLYLRTGTPFEPFLRGGGQEGGRRSGTENLMGIVGFCRACEVAEKELSSEDSLKTLRNLLAEEVQKIYPRAKIHTPLGEGESLPNTLSVAFTGQDAQKLLFQLNLKGVFVSAGSACSSASPKPSRVLLSMGVSKELALATLRFSLGRFTTEAQIRTTIAILGEILS